MATIRHRCTMGVFILASLAVFWFAMESSQLKTPATGELGVTTGGACYYCNLDGVAYCHNVGKSCGPTGFGTYRYVVAGKIDQKFCADADKYGPPGIQGKTGCTSINPKVCVTTYQCSDSDCANCGDPSTETKPTDCQFSGDNCTSSGG